MRRLVLGLLLACGGSAGDGSGELPTPPDGGAGVCTVANNETGDMLVVSCDLVTRAEEPRGCFRLITASCSTSTAVAEYEARRLAEDSGCDVVLDPMGTCGSP